MPYDARNIIQALQRHRECSDIAEERIIDIYKQLLDEIESRFEGSKDENVRLLGRKKVTDQNLRDNIKKKDDLDCPFRITVLVSIIPNPGDPIHNFSLSFEMNYIMNEAVDITCGRRFDFDDEAKVARLDCTRDALLKETDLRAYVDTLLQKMETMIRETPLGISPNSKVVLK